MDAVAGGDPGMGGTALFSLQPTALRVGIGAFTATTFTASNRCSQSPLGIHNIGEGSLSRN